MTFVSKKSGLKVQDEPVYRSALPAIYKALLTQVAPATINAGPLTVGETYTITAYVAGDDFTNVANVQSGVVNTNGCVFIATGTTPTDYSNGSTLDSAGNPVATVLENTLGDVVWTRSSAGVYFGTLAGAFPQDKTFYPPVAGVNIPFGGTNPMDSLIFWNDINSMCIATNNGVALADGILLFNPVQIEVYT